MQLEGEIRLPIDAPLVVTSNVCSGGTGFEDIRFGTLVTIVDVSGRDLGRGKLDQGYVRPYCAFLFTVRNVPTGLGTYGLNVAGRPTTMYSESQLQQLLVHEVAA